MLLGYEYIFRFYFSDTEIIMYRGDDGADFLDAIKHNSRDIGQIRSLQISDDEITEISFRYNKNNQ